MGIWIRDLCEQEALKHCFLYPIELDYLLIIVVMKNIGACFIPNKSNADQVYLELDTKLALILFED